MTVPLKRILHHAVSIAETDHLTLPSCVLIQQHAVSTLAEPRPSVRTVTNIIQYGLDLSSRNVVQPHDSRYALCTVKQRWSPVDGIAHVCLIAQTKKKVGTAHETEK
jgi:hypothetical protein